MSRNASTVTVEYVGYEWMVVQRMNAEDAREVAHRFPPTDGVHPELLQAADDVDRRNEPLP